MKRVELNQYEWVLLALMGNEQWRAQQLNIMYEHIMGSAIARSTLFRFLRKLIDKGLVQGVESNRLTWTDPLLYETTEEGRKQARLWSSVHQTLVKMAQGKAVIDWDTVFAQREEEEERKLAEKDVEVV